ncbi:MAG: nucleotidyltransferase family protein [Chitinophagales bacterium]
MKMLKDIQVKLATKLPELKKKYPISKLALFGSITRNDFKPKTSDIDIMVEFDGDIGWEYFDLVWEIQELFPGYKVDIVSKGAIQPHYWKHIKGDLQYV